MTCFPHRRAPLLVAAGLLLGGATACKTRLLDEELVLDGGGVIDGARTYDLAEPWDLVAFRNHCGDYAIETTHVVRADLLLLQDRSRSMEQRINGQSKWDLVRNAVRAAVSMTSSVDWGLMLFGADSQCNPPLNPEVPVGPGTANRIRQTLDATTPSASTPTAASLRNAVAYFRQLKDDHPHYILLATDGQPGCANGPGGGGGGGDDSLNAVRAVGEAAVAGVSTFVVGIGSTDGAANTLAGMARAGGVANTAPGQPPYYPVNNTQDLIHVLEQAALRITPCAYPVAGMPPDPNGVLIRGSRGTIPRDRSRMNGWDFSDDGKSFVFFGPACDDLRSGAVTQVRATYACRDR